MHHVHPIYFLGHSDPQNGGYGMNTATESVTVSVSDGRERGQDGRGRRGMEDPGRYIGADRAERGGACGADPGKQPTSRSTDESRQDEKQRIPLLLPITPAPPAPFPDYDKDRGVGRCAIAVLPEILGGCFCAKEPIYTMYDSVKRGEMEEQRKESRGGGRRGGRGGCSGRVEGGRGNTEQTGRADEKKDVSRTDRGGGEDDEEDWGGGNGERKEMRKGSTTKTGARMKEGRMTYRHINSSSLFLPLGSACDPYAGSPRATRPARRKSVWVGIAPLPHPPDINALETRIFLHPHPSPAPPNIRNRATTIRPRRRVALRRRVVHPARPSATPDVLGVSRSGWAAPRSSLELVGAFGDEATTASLSCALSPASTSERGEVGMGGTRWSSDHIGNEDGEDDESVPSGDGGRERGEKRAVRWSRSARVAEGHGRGRARVGEGGVSLFFAPLSRNQSTPSLTKPYPRMSPAHRARDADRLPLPGPPLPALERKVAEAQPSLSRASIGHHIRLEKRVGCLIESGRYSGLAIGVRATWWSQTSRMAGVGYEGPAGWVARSGDKHPLAVAADHRLAGLHLFHGQTTQDARVRLRYLMYPPQWTRMKTRSLRSGRRSERARGYGGICARWGVKCGVVTCACPKQKRYTCRVRSGCGRSEGSTGHGRQGSRMTQRNRRSKPDIWGRRRDESAGCRYLPSSRQVAEKRARQYFALIHLDLKRPEEQEIKEPGEFNSRKKWIAWKNFREELKKRDLTEMMGALRVFGYGVTACTSAMWLSFVTITTLESCLSRVHGWSMARTSVQK
ncbi:hypothetical protein B0H14DRAFT_3126309 [Mycena olivaceomarginata]|nr:hypothetical protein B0H14DRAFT_3126309 [Mycena olivaceomarginata]